MTEQTEQLSYKAFCNSLHLAEALSIFILNHIASGEVPNLPKAVTFTDAEGNVTLELDLKHASIILKDYMAEVLKLCYEFPEFEDVYEP